MGSQKTKIDVTTAKTLPFTGVCANQNQIQDDKSSRAIQLNFPIGSIFSCLIQSNGTDESKLSPLSPKVSVGNNRVIHPTVIKVSPAAKLTLQSISYDKTMSKEDNLGESVLHLATDTNPVFLPFAHFSKNKDCSVSGLGLEVCGPATLFLGLVSSGFVSATVFGTVTLLDKITTSAILEARNKAGMKGEIDVGNIIEVDGRNKSNAESNETPTTMPTPEENLSLTKRKNVTFEIVDSSFPNKKSDGKTINKKRKLNSEESNPDHNDGIPKNKTDKDQSSCIGISDSNNEPVAKLSKKQRRKLAKQKARELEEVIAKEKGYNNVSHDKKVPSHKDDNGMTKVVGVPSLTKERHLPGGLRVRDILIGTGLPVKSGRKASITYKGSLVEESGDGKVFDKNLNKNNPLVFRVGTGEVIKGLERGLDGMKVGGERIITIPPELGYGKKGSGKNIPSNATLSFEVQLLSIGGR